MQHVVCVQLVLSVQMANHQLHVIVDVMPLQDRHHVTHVLKSTNVLIRAWQLQRNVKMDITPLIQDKAFVSCVRQVTLALILGNQSLVLPGISVNRDNPIVLRVLRVITVRLELQLASPVLLENSVSVLLRIQLTAQRGHTQVRGKQLVNLAHLANARLSAGQAVCHVLQDFIAQIQVWTLFLAQLGCTLRVELHRTAQLALLAMPALTQSVHLPHVQKVLMPL